VLSADLDRDGIIDLATSNTDASTISVLLGAGDGSFEPRTDFACGGSPWGVAVGDLNGDGTPDLCTADRFTSTASVLIGHGDGTFAPKISYVTSSSPEAIVVADLDRDGHPDLATADALGSTVSVFRGVGDGTLTEWFRLGAGKMPRAIAAADLDRDGGTDLIVPNYTTSTLTLLLSEMGTTDAPLPTTPRSLELAPPYPNPTSGSIRFLLALPRASRPTVRVIDPAGRLVSTLNPGPLPAGRHVLTWDGRVASGGMAPNGIYFLDVETERDRRRSRIVVLH
jgi:hypothetical protein